MLSVLPLFEGFDVEINQLFTILLVEMIEQLRVSKLRVSKDLPHRSGPCGIHVQRHGGTFVGAVLFLHDIKLTAYSPIFKGANVTVL